MVKLGDNVTVKGVGARWSHSHYSVVVVDVRESDDTVKVKYTDGGYKRFPYADFQAVFVEDEDPYKFSACELFSDQYDPTTETVDNLAKKRKEINAAVKTLDLTQAQKLKDELHALVAKTEEWNTAKQNMLYAIHKEQYDEAAEYKQRVQDLYRELTSAGAKPDSVGTQSILQKSLQRAMGGGLAGAAAMVIQVCTLMWMRTTMNYQYMYGTSTKEALLALYKEGGIRRFYRGTLPALFQGPLSRFGDTAANTGVLAFLNASENTQNLPVAAKTVFASMGAATWRIFLMPLDTLKTTMQVEGQAGVSQVMGKFRSKGPTVFYHGALAASAATFAGHYPWFVTFNTLQAKIPEPDSKVGKLSRNAFIGFCSSFVSDTTSNSIRVVKTYRQTHSEVISYPTAVKDIIAQDGLMGLFGRGLGTRLIANGFQGVMFSVMWKAFEPKINAMFEK